MEISFRFNLLSNRNWGFWKIIVFFQVRSLMIGDSSVLILAMLGQGYAKKFSKFLICAVQIWMLKWKSKHWNENLNQTPSWLWITMWNWNIKYLQLQSSATPTLWCGASLRLNYFDSKGFIFLVASAMEIVSAITNQLHKYLLDFSPFLSKKRECLVHIKFLSLSK